MPYDEITSQVLTMTFEQKMNILYLIIKSFNKNDNIINDNEIIEKRINYLSENLDEDQDSKLFNLSVNLFRKIIVQLNYSKLPRLGVDDSGILVAQWDNYEDFEIITIRFIGETQVSLTALKKDKIVINSIGVPSEIISTFNRL